MQSVSLPLLLAAVLAGVVGGVIGGAVLGGAEGEAALPPRVDSASDPELAQRIADLEALQAAHAATLRAWAAGPPSESVQRQPEGDWVERGEPDGTRSVFVVRACARVTTPIAPCVIKTPVFRRCRAGAAGLKATTRRARTTRDHSGQCPWL